MDVPIHPMKRGGRVHSSVPEDDHGGVAWDDSDWVAFM
jgi:hypothetical protein